METSEITSWLAIYTGLVVGVLKLADWLLLPNQRQWVIQKGEDLWLRLADVDTKRLLAAIGNKKFAYRASLTIHGLLALFFLFGLANMLLGEIVLVGEQFWFGLACAIGFVALFAVAGFVLRKPWHIALSWYASKGNLLLFIMKTLLTFFLLYLVLNYVVLSLIEQMIDGGGELETNPLFDWKWATLYLVTLVVFFSVYLFMLLFFIIYAGMILMSILWLLLHALRFVLLRVVENEKGPVLGLAGLLIAIGAIAKSFE